MFVSPAKNIAQCTDVQSKLHGVEAKRLQNKLVTTLEFHESIHHQVTRELLQACFKVVLFPNAL